MKKIIVLWFYFFPLLLMAQYSIEDISLLIVNDSLVHYGYKQIDAYKITKDTTKVKTYFYSSKGFLDSTYANMPFFSFEKNNALQKETPIIFKREVYNYNNADLLTEKTTSTVLVSDTILVDGNTIFFDNKENYFYDKRNRKVKEIYTDCTSNKSDTTYFLYKGNKLKNKINYSRELNDVYHYNKKQRKTIIIDKTDTSSHYQKRYLDKNESYISKYKRNENETTTTVLLNNDLKLPITYTTSSTTSNTNNSLVVFYYKNGLIRKYEEITLYRDDYVYKDIFIFRYR